LPLTPPALRMARLLGAAVLWLMAAVLVAAPAHADETQSIGRIELTPGKRVAFPAADALWQSHRLPMRWSSSGGRSDIWLRYSFDLQAQPQEGWSILFEVLANGGLVYLNGKMVAEVPLDSDKRHVHWRRPHLINLPSEYLHAGQNQVLVFTSYGAGVHGIGEIDVGPTAELQPQYGREFFVSHTLRWISLLLTILLAMGFAALWSRRRSESLFGLLSLIAAFWALRSLDSVFESLPGEARMWTRGAFYVGTAAFAALATITMWRQSGRQSRTAEGGLIFLAALGPLLLALAGDLFDITVGPAWQAVMLGALGVGLLSLARHALSVPTFMVKGIVFAIGVALAAAVHDYLVYVGVLPYGHPELLNIATPILLVALGSALIDRFVRSLADVEKTNTELESRIHEREQLLKRNFDRLRESERVKASAQERQRIMQDMHDGLGSQLLSSLMLVERGALSNEQVAQILRESIDDMRLAIDALAAEDSDLLSALGNMRFRMEPRLKAAGMEMQWDARGLPEDVDIDPDAVLPVLRIVQEALTNAIKHSRARAVRVTLGVDSDGEAQWLVIRVTDNGRGLAASTNTSGRGMLNMRNRAGRIGGLLKVETVPGAGTMILLRLPLHAGPGPTTRGQQLPLNTEAVIERVRQG
jgi:signal transduction histidine kinase